MTIGHTTDEIIEAMARASWSFSNDRFCKWELTSDVNREFMRRQASAAYAACLRMLMEPSQSQKDAAMEADFAAAQRNIDGRYWICYSAMINTRIKELEETPT